MEGRIKSIICRHLEGYEGNINSNADFVISLLAEQISAEELTSNLHDTLRGKDPQIFISWLLGFIKRINESSTQAVEAEEAALAAQPPPALPAVSIPAPARSSDRFDRDRNSGPRGTRGQRRDDRREITITRDNFDHDGRQRKNDRNGRDFGSNNSSNRRNIHDQLCPRDPHCDKEGCPFKHTVQPIHNVSCRFDPKCTNLKCPFKHTIPPEIVIKMQKQEELINKLTIKLTSMPSLGVAPGGGGGGVPSAPPCINGFACSGRADKTCRFSHPRIKCAHRDDGACKFGHNCRFSHAPDCKFGAKCTKAGCIFAHPNDAEMVASRDVSMNSGVGVGAAAVPVGAPQPPTPFVVPLAPVPPLTQAVTVPVPVPVQVSVPVPTAAASASAVSTAVVAQEPAKVMCPNGINCDDPECPYDHPNSAGGIITTI